MRRFRKARLIAFCFAVSIVACGSFWDHLLGPLREGPHRIQPTTAADIQRARDLTACLAGWAGGDYSDVDVTRLVIVRVGGDGVIGSYNGATWQTVARENGDTIFINEGVDNSTFVGLERHEIVHLVQSYHRELIGSDGDIHWPAPFNACRVPLAVFR